MGPVACGSPRDVRGIRHERRAPPAPPAVPTPPGLPPPVAGRLSSFSKLQRSPKAVQGNRTPRTFLSLIDHHRESNVSVLGRFAASTQGRPDLKEGHGHCLAWTTGHALGSISSVFLDLCGRPRARTSQPCFPLRPTAPGGPPGRDLLPERAHPLGTDERDGGPELSPKAAPSPGPAGARHLREGSSVRAWLGGQRSSREGKTTRGGAPSTSGPCSRQTRTAGVARHVRGCCRRDWGCGSCRRQPGNTRRLSLGGLEGRDIARPRLPSTRACRPYALTCHGRPSISSLRQSDSQ